MLVVGKTDAFEQAYMAKFGQLAEQYGIFVKYERDRAARDIGLHLTKNLKSGQKQVTNSLVWFQMKGVMATTLSKERFEAAGRVSLTMDVEHLRHWFLDKEPTHLVVYVESVDAFLVMNLQQYVTRTWGRAILKLDQKTATVTIPSNSALDEQAFAILIRHAEIAQWMKALNATYDEAELISAHYDVIYAFGTAEDREVQLGLLWRKWISKTRHELRIGERPVDFEGDSDEGWDVRHEHWEFMGIDLGASYPYLDLFAPDDYEPPMTFTNRWGEVETDEVGETITLKNGDQIFAPDCSGEYCEFVLGARLNELGQKLFEYVKALLDMGLLELRSSEEEGHTFISVAPWHHRHV